MKITTPFMYSLVKSCSLITLFIASVPYSFGASIPANSTNCNVATFSSPNIVLPSLPEAPVPPLNPPQLVIESATVVNSATLGEYCDVIGHIHTEHAHTVVPAEVAALSQKEIQIEVKLPTIWNTKFLQYGGGGFDGSIASATVPGFGFTATQSNSPLSATYSTDGGYVISATDAGHGTPLASSFINTDGTQNIQRWFNYTYQSRHILAIASKLMINQYYGSMPTLSYHGGFSKGGASSLMAAGRYPNDFDGILAGAPAISIIDIIERFTAAMQAQFPGPCTSTTPNDCLATQVVPVAGANNVMPLIAAATMNKCDAQDGLVDGVISRPENCDFNVMNDVPTCTAGPSPNCLTPAQKNVMAQLYNSNPYNGNFNYNPGYESDPGRLVAQNALGATPTTAMSSMYLLGDQAGRYWVYNNPAYTLQSFNFLTSQNDFSHWPSTYDVATFDNYVVNPNLTSFQTTGGTHGTGGKLLLFSGLADTLVSPNIVTDWYQTLVSNMGGISNVRNFARFFLIIGRAHSSAVTGVAAGAPGNVEVVQGLNAGFLHTLENWVEHGQAPDYMIGSNTAPTPITRPICAFPNEPVYVGAAGDTAAMRVASNWECRNYNFQTFAPPVANLPAVNMVKAGQAIPVQFSLSGNWGLNILAAGNPLSEPIMCDTFAPLNNMESTNTAGNSALQYDATMDQYTYVWKTNKSWAGSCRQLQIRLNEGTLLKANFNFH